MRIYEKINIEKEWVSEVIEELINQGKITENYKLFEIIKTHLIENIDKETLDEMMESYNENMESLINLGEIPSIAGIGMDLEATILEKILISLDFPYNFTIDVEHKEEQFVFKAFHK